MIEDQIDRSLTLNRNVRKDPFICFYRRYRIAMEQIKEVSILIAFKPTKKVDILIAVKQSDLFDLHVLKTVANKNQIDLFFHQSFQYCCRFLVCNFVVNISRISNSKTARLYKPLHIRTWSWSCKPFSLNFFQEHDHNNAQGQPSLAHHCSRRKLIMISVKSIF